MRYATLTVPAPSVYVLVELDADGRERRVTGYQAARPDYVVKVAVEGLTQGRFARAAVRQMCSGVAVVQVEVVLDTDAVVEPLERETVTALATGHTGVAASAPARLALGVV